MIPNDIIGEIFARISVYRDCVSWAGVCRANWAFWRKYRAEIPLEIGPNYVCLKNLKLQGMGPLAQFRAGEHVILVPEELIYSSSWEYEHIYFIYALGTGPTLKIADGKLMKLTCRRVFWFWTDTYEEVGTRRALNYLRPFIIHENITPQVKNHMLEACKRISEAQKYREDLEALKKKLRRPDQPSPTWQGPKMSKKMLRRPGPKNCRGGSGTN